MDIDFLLGVSSAAAQIEGGDLPTNWNDWYKKGHIKDGASPGRANDHLHRWKEDIDLMAEMGITIYRLGIEWARLEPVMGRYDNAARDWYRSLLLYMKSKGISPLLTLHHFTNPMWFEETGGFTNPANIPVFLGFVEYAVRQFGDLVDEYVTINEPNVFAVMGYFTGVFPPGKKSVPLALKVQSILASCHILSYQLIHRVRKEMGCKNTAVGFAHHARVFEPKSKVNPLHIICTGLAERSFQGLLVRACRLGRFAFPLTRYGETKAGEYADFLGLNYYTRSTISNLGDGVRGNVPLNDLGWEIYPQGIVTCA
ncbi:MAG: family 1 glycosylhydrolase, partial [Treponema sp.]|nr:family 1 glycosylhydrolase [Treponema sp.]